MRTRHIAALAALLMGPASAHAQPVMVDYTVTGSAGNWLFHFTLVNNMVGESADMGVYLFGAKLNGTAIVATPAGWSPGSTWGYTASGLVYDNVWSKNNGVGVMPGQSLGGFTAASYSLAAPTTIDWFAYAYSNSGQQYNGTGSFLAATSNPGFESQSSYPLVLITSVEGPNEPGDNGRPPVTTTPEPSTYALMATGLAALGYASRRRARSRVAR